MADKVRILMLGKFSIYVGDQPIQQQLQRSKKGMLLIQYLLLNRNDVVPNYRLCEVLWPNDESANPGNALKTLISRLRAIFAEYSEDLADCIDTRRGSYRWKSELGIEVDLFEFDDLCRELYNASTLDAPTRARYRRVFEIYSGDLLPGSDEEDWILSRSIRRHDMYLKIAYSYIDLLEKQEDYDEIIDVCRHALTIDAFDEKLHLSLMDALVKTKRNNEALLQYKHATNMHFKYLGVQPPESIQEFYKQIVKAGQTLDMDIDAIRRELQEYGDVRGAFVCEYAVFKEIYNLQMRNLERMGSSMYIALIMLTGMDQQPLDSLKLNELMERLLDVLARNLRKGDTITQFSAAQFALLLPTVNNQTAALVMERVRRAFYKVCPNSSIMFTYRFGPLASSTNAARKAIEAGAPEEPAKG